MFPFHYPLLQKVIMKKILLPLMVLALISCIRENEEQKQITVSLDQVKVKTAFASSREKLMWENGDKIGVYHDATGLQNTVLEYTGNSQMTLPLPLSAQNIYAVFPYSTSAGENPHRANIVIPTNQKQDTPGVLTGPMWPMSAAATIENDHASLLFRPLTSLLALNIYSSAPEDNEAVTQVSVTPTVNSRFCGTALVDLTSTAATFTSGDSSDPITLTVTNSKTLTKEKPSDPRLFEDQLYINIARQKYTYLKFDIYTSAGKLYTITSNDTPINADEYNVIALNINLSKGKLTIINDGQTEELIEVDGTLSSLETIIRDPMDEDITEDIIPDFSRVGYHYGDDEIPYYTNVIATLEPTGDKTDRLAEIQAALDAADGSTNSVVLLKAGDYYISNTINVRKNHLVLRGEGGDKDNIQTRIIAVGDSTMSACIRLGGEQNQITDTGSLTEVIEQYVPVGRMSLRIHDAAKFSIGDRIIIYRPGTSKWIHDIKMDAISDGEHWEPEIFHINQERIITGIIGNKIMLDAPIVMAIDSYYGGGYVIKMTKNRIFESGIENLFLESTYDPSVTRTILDDGYYSHREHFPEGIIYVDENHCHNGVKAVACEHCWVKGVSGQHFVFSMVGLGNNSRNVTVEDCHSYMPVSLIQGSRRYAFNANSKTSLGLVKDCTAEYDRHQFVTTQLSTGPLVFTNCSATHCLGETGPHCFWAAGVLYDCIKMDSNKISVQDSDYVGTGASHGWQGANHVLWNCEAPQIVCQSPWTAEGQHPSGKNYCIGCIGTKKLSTTKHFVTREYLNDRPQAEWIPDPGAENSNNTHVTSGTYYGATANGLSLYEAQLEARKSAGIRAIPASWYK